MPDTYKIVRMYRDPEKKNKTVTRGLDLQSAQSWCKRPNTKRNIGDPMTWWFDGYELDK